MPMKSFVPSLLFACLFTLLLHGFTAICQATNDSPAPDYKVLVNAIFDKADSCKITGYYGGTYAGGTTLEIDFTTPDASSLQYLRDRFLFEKPRYLGSKVPRDLGYGYIHSFHFTWLDKQGKKIARAALLGGDMLTFNQNMLFTTSPSEYKSVTLLEGVAYLILKKNAQKKPGVPAQPAGPPSSSKGN
jgi:hypothetical protein